jgi:molecular chaperone GrpE
MARKKDKTTNEENITGTQSNVDVAEANVTTPEELLKEELEKANDKYLRLFAEFDNFRKRTQKEKSDWISTASEDLIKKLLPVVDDFERAMTSLEKSGDLETLKQGIQLVQHKLLSTLEQQGLKAIENPSGKELDTDLHEAITSISAPSEELKGKIIDQVEKGYRLNEKVIRYAKVVVGQ